MKLVQHVVIVALLVGSGSSCTVKARECESSSDCFVGEVCGSDGECVAGEPLPDVRDDGSVAPAEDMAGRDVRETPPTDLGVDMGGPDRGDGGRADVGPPQEMGIADTGPADVGTPGSYEIVQRFSMNLGGSPGLDSPAQVAMFESGFIAGYVDTGAGEAHVGWFTEDESVPLDTRSFQTEKPSFDLAGDSERGFVVMVKPQEQIVVVLEENPAMPNTFTQTFDGGSTTVGGVEYHEMSVGMEAGRAYIGEIREYSGIHLDVAAYSTSYNFVTDRLNFTIEQIEAIGGGAPGNDRRFLVAGITNASYSVVDFYWDQAAGNWSNPALGCGAAPSEDLGPRIVPLHDRWVLLNAPTVGPTEWRLARCDDDNTVESVVTRPDASVGVDDFDAAEETVLLGAPIVAWIQGGDVWIGVLEIVENSPSGTIVDAYQIPDASGTHVRAAFNADRSTVAVAVHAAAGAELILLKKQ